MPVGQAVQQAERFAAQRGLLRRLRFLARALVAHRGDRVDGGIEALDALDARFEQLDGRDFLRADAAAQLDGGKGQQFFVGGHMDFR